MVEYRIDSKREVNTIRDEIEIHFKRVANELIEDESLDDILELEDINNGFCAEASFRVVNRLSDLDNIKVYEGGGMNFLHIWIGHLGYHFDTENPEGVNDPSEMEFFKRHGRFDYHELDVIDRWLDNG